jgi:hypothetical protein
VFCDALQQLALADPVRPASADPEELFDLYESRLARLDALVEQAEGTHYVAIAREESERIDVERTQYFLGRRAVTDDGDVLAVAELQRVVIRHRESKNANRHLLALADLYSDLAVEYVEANPAESLHFDPVHFQELTDAAARLYEMVANQDGTPEKLEASRRLEAFLAFALKVDRDRFTP